MACTLISAGATDFVQAKELYFQPYINIHTEYDDNKRLRSDNLVGIDKSSIGVITRANAIIGVRSDRYDLMLNNQVVINRYDSDFDLDSEDYHLNFKSNYDVTERNTFGLRGSYALNTTLTSEFDENGTGLVQDNISREHWTISPDWTYIISNTQFLQAHFIHSEVSYEENTSGSFVDFSTDNLTLSFSHQWTELFRNFLSVSVMFFEVPEIHRDTTEYTVSVGADYQFLPTWSASLTVGRRFTNTMSTVFLNNVGITTSSDIEAMVFTFAINKKFDTGSADINYSRSTSAQGNGQLREQDRFLASYRYNIRHNLFFSLDGGVIIDSSSGGQNSSNDRTYYHIRPRISWKFNENTRITTGYQYRRQERDGSDTAESNSVFVNFIYQWNKLSTQKY